MSFNMAAYQNVVNTEKDVREAKQKNMSKAGEKQAATQNFKVDKIAEFKEAAEEASARFGLGRLGGMIMGIGLTALTGGAAAPLIMAGSSALGGAIGAHNAKSAMKDSNYFKRSKDNITRTMTKGIIGDTIMAGLMGGITGGAESGLAQGGEGLSKVGKGIQGTKNFSGFMSNVKTIGTNIAKPANIGAITGGKSMFDQIIANDSTIEQDAYTGTGGM
mgnify:CR=1 FL=1